MNEKMAREAILSRALCRERSGSPQTAPILRAVEAAIDRTPLTGRRTLAIGQPHVNHIRWLG